MTGSTLEQLRDISRVLLNEETAPDDLTLACRDLWEMLCRVAGQEAVLQAVGDSRLSNGLALSPAGAAACVQDSLRTAMFVRGLYAAVAEARRRFPGTCIEVVYAGSGPFATLVLPVMAVSSPEDVRFTLIDIHAESIGCVGTILSHFGFTSFVRRTVVGDATEYEHPRELPLHIVLSETLQQALAVEPQVAVTRQLAPQLTAGGFLIPQEVTVDLVLEDPEVLIGAERQSPRVPVGRVLTLDKSAGELSESGGLISLGELTVPAASERAVPAYVTEIVVFRTLRLTERDSGLTLPLPISTLHGLREGEQVAFHYLLGRAPGITHKRLSECAAA
jgi:hypothetical protein